MRAPALICCILLQVTSPAWGRNVDLTKAIAGADAIAEVQVIRICESIDGGIVSKHAKLRVVGKSFGLEPNTNFDTLFWRPSNVGTLALASDAPMFVLGEHSIVLAIRRTEKWTVIRQIQLSRDRNVMEPDILKALGLADNTDAVTVMRQLLERKLRGK